MQPAGADRRSLHVRTPSHGFDSLVGSSNFGSSPNLGGGLPSSASSGALFALSGGAADTRTPAHSRSSSLGGAADLRLVPDVAAGRAARSRQGGPAAVTASRARKTLELALGCALVAWLLVIFITSHGRFDVSTTRRVDARGRVAEGGGAQAVAGRPPLGAALCTSAGAPPAGRFLLPRAAYSPGRVAGGGSKSRVFALTAVWAGDASATRQLQTWLQHYTELGVAPQHMLVLAQVGAADAPGGDAGAGIAAGSALDDWAAAADAAGAFVDVWVGQLPPFSVVAARWAALLGRYSRRGDWVVVTDVDELLEMPPGQSLPSAAASAAALGYNFLLAHRVEMSLPAADGDATSSNTTMALERCTLPRSAQSAGTQSVTESTASCAAIPHRGPIVVAARGASRMATAVRPLLDVGIDDRGAYSLAPPSDAYPVQLPLRHHAWGPGAEARAKRQADAVSACLGAESPVAVQATRVAEELASSHGWVTPTTCHPLRCHHIDELLEATSAQPAMPSSAHGERRIAIVTSVWDHVDGVSKTLRTVTTHLLNRRDDTSMLLLTPDVAGGGLTSSPLRRAASRAANAHPGLVVVPIPSLPAPGRPDYRWAPPLPGRAASELALFAPDAVHVAAPDFLGHSAVAWARAHGVCALCTHHTAFPTYLQYYGAGLAEPVVEAFMGRFYRRCDYVAVPSYAAADALAHAGVPRSKLGFFPRGVNASLYRPQARSETWRTEVAGVSMPQERVVLWVARIVREKGLDMFVASLEELWRRRRAAVLEHGGEAQADEAAFAAAARTPPVYDEEAPPAFPPAFRVVVAGTGPDLAWLQSRMPAWPPVGDSGGGASDEEVGVGSPEAVIPVRYVGHASGHQLATALASSDVFYFPSKTEVFPNNVAEAMASGLPVVAEDVPSIAALLEHNRTGWLVHLADTAEEQTKRVTAAAPAAATAAAHAHALSLVLSNDALRARLGAAATAATHGLTWRRAVEALVRGYDTCAAHKRAERLTGGIETLEKPERSGGRIRKVGPKDGFTDDDVGAAVEDGSPVSDVLVLDSGVAPDALIFRVGANLTGRYVYAPPKEERRNSSIAGGGATR